MASRVIAQQSSGEARAPPAEQTAAARADESSKAALTSTQEGVVPASDSLKSRRKLIAELQRKGWQDTVFNWQLRTYDISWIKSDDSRAAAWAAGGSAGFQTGVFYDLLSFGATGYTSQPLYAPSDQSGTRLLSANQGGYTVLGEAFVQFRISDTLDLAAGDRGFDTPYLSRNDGKMTPQTFEAVALLGTAGGEGEGGEEGELRYGAGYADKEKQIDSEDFVNMARIAGASVDRGVGVAGANYATGQWSFGAFEYYCPDIINIAYTETTYGVLLSEARKVNLFAQYTSEHSVGAELLPGGYFSTDQFGVKAELASGGTLLTVAYTATGRGANMRNPWSAYPGFTGAYIQSFNLAGEDAYMLRAAYEPKEIPGFSVYGLWVHGTTTQSPGPLTQDEYDAQLQWSPGTGPLEGLMFRAVYAVATQPNTTTQRQLRLLLFYTPPRR